LRLTPTYFNDIRHKIVVKYNGNKFQEVYI
jgi:hypothetical protein